MACRSKLPEQELPRTQPWVPDVSSPVFAAEAHRQSLAVANSPGEAEDQAFIDSITDWTE